MLFNSIFTSDNTLFVLRAIRRLAFGDPLCGSQTRKTL